MSIRWHAPPPDRPTAGNNFDGLRLIAALMVVYGHVMPDATGTAGLRVLMFFAISGFLVAGSWQSDPHAVRFMQRRLLRIWPAFAVMVVVCAAVSAVFPAPDMPEISRLGSLFFLSNLWFAGFDWGFFRAANPFLNVPIWSIPFELNLYLAFALVGGLNRRLLPWIAGVVWLAALWAPAVMPQPTGLMDAWSLNVGGYFAFGLLMRRFDLLRKSTSVSGIVVIGVVLMIGGARDAGLLCVIPAVAVWVGERSWPVIRSAARFGDLSLGIFLWAWPVQQVTRLWLDPQVPPVVALAVVLVQAAAIAWLSWHLIERPALRWRPARRPVPDSAHGAADAADVVDVSPRAAAV